MGDEKLESVHGVYEDLAGLRPLLRGGHRRAKARAGGKVVNQGVGDAELAVVESGWVLGESSNPAVSGSTLLALRDLGELT